jgi:ring-1,2-phenylacetyl-CoA epoxidase subunit PaaD
VVITPIPGQSASVARAWAILESLPDPEIPVVSIRELGILREVSDVRGMLQVVITPTYSGCPAMGQIEDDIVSTLAAQGLAATVVTRLAPGWTTDWITPDARQRLREYGIAPPHAVPADDATTSNVVRFAARKPADAVACPRCGSEDTTETSHFSSTACKALYRCLACREPFDYFKTY